MVVAAPQWPVGEVHDEVVGRFRRRGWVAVDLLDEEQVATVRGWVAEISDHPGLLHHREMTESGPRLCRTEDFVPFHGGLGHLLREGPVMAMASALLGEPAVLYKEKVNYKPAGGAGYAPHQDAPAYPLVERHVSAMIAIDDATAENGCLDLVSGVHLGLLPTDDGGRIRADVADGLDWRPMPLAAGRILWFDSLTPHRSGPNPSDAGRRALYPTYNAASEGDRRDEYYRAKRDALATGGRSDGMTRVSLIDDFLGREVE